MAETSELQQQTQGLISDIINRIHDDAGFKDAMLADAEGALATNGYADQIDQLVDYAESESEVAGFAFEVAPLLGISRPDLKGTTILASGSGGCSGSCGCSSRCAETKSKFGL